MAVVFDSAASTVGEIWGATTSGTMSVTHTVNPSARSLVVAYVGVMLVTGVNTTGITLSVSFGGTAMTALSSRTWNSNQETLRVFTLLNPPTGSRTVTVTYSGLTTELFNRVMMVSSGTWAGIDSTGIGTPVLAGGSSSTSNSVTVSSTLPAHKVITFHAAGRGFSFSAYNKTKRADVRGPWGTGQLIMGEAPGESSVVSTATQGSTANWGAWGATHAPSIVDGGFSLTTPVSVSETSGSTYRTATPAPDRYWAIPADTRSIEVPS